MGKERDGKGRGREKNVCSFKVPPLWIERHKSFLFSRVYLPSTYNKSPLYSRPKVIVTKLVFFVSLIYLFCCVTKALLYHRLACLPSIHFAVLEISILCNSSTTNVWFYLSKNKGVLSLFFFAYALLLAAKRRGTKREVFGSEIQRGRRRTSAHLAWTT